MFTECLCDRRGFLEEVTFKWRPQGKRNRSECSSLRESLCEAHRRRDTLQPWRFGMPEGSRMEKGAGHWVWRGVKAV